MKFIFDRAAAGAQGGVLFDLSKLRRSRRDQNQAAIRSLCATAYLGDETALCRVLGRYKMFVDTRDVGLSSHLMLDGYWEMWLSEVMVQVLRKGMIAADVGANLGYFTLLMASRVGPGGAVHAFEPNPPIADRLSKSIDVNGFTSWVTLHRDPLGREDGLEVRLAVPEGEPKNAHVVPGAELAGGVPLRTRRFDSHPELLEADVIKIDVEGAELDVWRGMAGLLERRSKPLTIFLEFASVRYADPGGFLDEIAAHGFGLGDVSLQHGVRARTRAEILAAPGHLDQMLILRR